MQQPVYHLKGIIHTRETLDDFEGPLDLIVQLLRKKKIEIQDVCLSDILEQYLAWMAEMKRMDMEIASEFVAMASYLVYIKSKMLVSSEEEKATDEMDLLIRSLEERERKRANAQIKQASAWLSQRDQIGLFMFPKPADPLPTVRPYDVRHNPYDLLCAFAGILDREAQRLPPSVLDFAGIAQAEPYPVTLKSAQILQRLTQNNSISLPSLLSGCSGRSELVAVFLALLELCRLGSITFSENESNETKITFLRMPEEETQ